MLFGGGPLLETWPMPGGGTFIDGGSPGGGTFIALGGGIPGGGIPKNFAIQLDSYLFCPKISFVSIKNKLW